MVSQTVQIFLGSQRSAKRVAGQSEYQKPSWLNPLHFIDGQPRARHHRCPQLVLHLVGTPLKSTEAMTRNQLHQKGHTHGLCHSLCRSWCQKTQPEELTNPKLEAISRLHSFTCSTTEPCSQGRGDVSSPRKDFHEVSVLLFYSWCNQQATCIYLI